MLRISLKLVKQGVKDMLPMSDALMGGTSHGAYILYVPPEAQISGPLALVQTGDMITGNVPSRRFT